MKMVVAIMDSAMGVGSNLFSPPETLYADYYSLAYLLPNDESESDRLDMLHELMLQVLHRKLYLAPLKNPQRAIDLATGTGIWAIDFGKFVFQVLPMQNTDTNSS